MTPGAMTLDDVRRLTGVNLLWERSGAVGEAELAAGWEAVTIAIWRRQMRRLLDSVGWGGEEVGVRTYPGGATLGASAPRDALYTATDLVEWSWRATTAILDGEAPPDLEAAAEGFRRAIASESDPRLIALAGAAERHGVTFLHGEELVSLGLGAGGRSWPEDALPRPEEVDWKALSDVPVALVTGTNGKSTTVRLTAAIAAAAGRSVGLCSSDWVRVAGEVVARGDYSGPGGARRALRDERVELAVLEVARGGLMRRGLTLARAEACLITNVAADHLGDYGIHDVAGLVEAKFLIARAVGPGGRLVLNADDPSLRTGSAGFGGEIAWFTLAPGGGVLSAWLAAGGEACFIEDGYLVLAREGRRTPVLAVDAFPPAMGGAARHNLANGLGAILLASALGLPVAAMADGLAGFGGGPEENPGRGNLLELGGVSILVDFAHNPHGLAALLDVVEALPARRRLIVLGQAGDRGDADIRDLVRTAWRARPDRVVVKDMASMLRGREPGTVPAVIADELRRLGAPPEIVTHAANEIEATRQALTWAREGDLLILLLHVERQQVLDLLEDLRQRDWRPGAGL